MLSRYTNPAQMEPLLPQQHLAELLVLAQEVVDLSSNLKNSLHPVTAVSLAALLRAMNSYYSNKIEGHSTHPHNIERALQQDFSAQPDIALLQRLALAHIDTEVAMEAWLSTEKFSPFVAQDLNRIHKQLYENLPEVDRKTKEGLIVIPGASRTCDVQVGQHVPPQAAHLAPFLERYQTCYNKPQLLPAQELIKIACAHQRLAWIHPFLDGNGRVARLATHAALYQNFTGGLWSVCRGFARTQADYYIYLAGADAARQGDLDGRGNLSEKGLAEFCRYFLNVCRDQLNFMHKMLNLEQMRIRIKALVIFRSETEHPMRREAELPLYHLFAAGPLKRTEFKRMTGLGDRVAQGLLAHLLKTGLVISDTALGNLRFGLPLDTLQFYFPDLYPEAAMQYS